MQRACAQAPHTSFVSAVSLLARLVVGLLAAGLAVLVTRPFVWCGFVWRGVQQAKQAAGRAARRGSLDHAPAVVQRHISGLSDDDPQSVSDHPVPGDFGDAMQVADGPDWSLSPRPPTQRSTNYNHAFKASGVGDRYSLSASPASVNSPSPTPSSGTNNRWMSDSDRSPRERTGDGFARSRGWSRRSSMTDDSPGSVHSSLAVRRSATDENTLTEDVLTVGSREIIVLRGHSPTPPVAMQSPPTIVGPAMSLLTATRVVSPVFLRASGELEDSHVSTPLARSVGSMDATGLDQGGFSPLTNARSEHAESGSRPDTSEARPARPAAAHAKRSGRTPRESEPLLLMEPLDDDTDDDDDASSGGANNDGGDGQAVARPRPRSAHHNRRPSHVMDSVMDIQNDTGPACAPEPKVVNTQDRRSRPHTAHPNRRRKIATPGMGEMEIEMEIEVDDGGGTGTDSDEEAEFASPAKDNGAHKTAAPSVPVPKVVKDRPVAAHIRRRKTLVVDDANVVEERHNRPAAAHHQRPRRLSQPAVKDEGLTITVAGPSPPPPPPPPAVGGGGVGAAATDSGGDSRTMQAAPEDADMRPLAERPRRLTLAETKNEALGTSTLVAPASADGADRAEHDTGSGALVTLARGPAIVPDKGRASPVDKGDPSPAAVTDGALPPAAATTGSASPPPLPPPPPPGSAVANTPLIASPAHTRRHQTVDDNTLARAPTPDFNFLSQAPATQPAQQPALQIAALPTRPTHAPLSPRSPRSAHELDAGGSPTSTGTSPITDTSITSELGSPSPSPSSMLLDASPPTAVQRVAVAVPDAATPSPPHESRARASSASHRRRSKSKEAVGQLGAEVAAGRSHVLSEGLQRPPKHSPGRVERPEAVRLLSNDAKDGAPSGCTTAAAGSQETSSAALAAKGTKADPALVEAPPAAIYTEPDVREAAIVGGEEIPNAGRRPEASAAPPLPQSDGADPKAATVTSAATSAAASAVGTATSAASSGTDDTPNPNPNPPSPTRSQFRITRASLASSSLVTNVPRVVPSGPRRRTRSTRMIIADAAEAAARNERLKAKEAAGDGEARPGAAHRKRRDQTERVDSNPTAIANKAKANGGGGGGGTSTHLRRSMSNNAENTREADATDAGTAGTAGAATSPGAAAKARAPKIKPPEEGVVHKAPKKNSRRDSNVSSVYRSKKQPAKQAAKARGAVDTVGPAEAATAAVSTPANDTDTAATAAPDSAEAQATGTASSTAPASVEEAKLKSSGKKHPSWKSRGGTAQGSKRSSSSAKPEMKRSDFIDSRKQLNVLKHTEVGIKQYDRFKDDAYLIRMKQLQDKLALLGAQYASPRDATNAGDSGSPNPSDSSGEAAEDSGDGGIVDDMVDFAMDNDGPSRHGSPLQDVQDVVEEVL